MGKIVNVRIDGRLIHGQVCTQWVHQVGGKKIFIVDDVVAKDTFLSQICVMAAPNGTTLECLTCEEAAKRYNENEFGTPENIFVIFQTLDMAIKAWDAGFHFPTLNFGTTLNKGAMTFTGVAAISINPDHAQKVQEISKSGCVVTLQETPSAPVVEWETVRARCFPDVK